MDFTWSSILQIARVILYVSAAINIIQSMFTADLQKKVEHKISATLSVVLASL